MAGQLFLLARGHFRFQRLYDVHKNSNYVHNHALNKLRQICHTGIELQKFFGVRGWHYCYCLFAHYSV